MRLPPLRAVLAEGRESFLRFSFVIVAAVIGTVSAMLLMERDSYAASVMNVLQKLLLTALLGVPLLTSLTIAAERRALAVMQKTLLLACGVALLLLYYLMLPADLAGAPTIYLIRTTAFAVALHLLVSFAPYTGRGEVSAFWEFNKILFLRLLTAALYTFVLWVGISIALLAVHELFNVEIPDERYFQMFALLAGLFNTWFFLAGVPRDAAVLDAERAYPKGLKVFVQFVLIPLVTIYLIILYAYSVKIILDWDWPKGWVAYLVIGFSLSGILAILLVHPIARREGNRFLYLFSRGYYAALLPMTALLFLAIWRRISEYGITERRYYVLVLALWLAGIILYFLISRHKSIKMIPLSLCAVAFLTTFGPWGAQSVAAKSQLGRLEALLVKNGILVDGKVGPAPGAVALGDARKISSILRHFTEVNGTDPLKPWFPMEIDTVGIRTEAGRIFRDGDQTARQLAVAMHVHYVEEWEWAATLEYGLSVPETSTLNVAGYEGLVRLNYLGYGDERKVFRAGEEEWRVSYQTETQTLVVRRTDAHDGQTAEGAAPSAVFRLTPFVRQLLRDESIMAAPKMVPPARMVLDATAGPAKFRLLFSSLVCNTRGDSTFFTNGSCYLLVGRSGQ